MAKSKTQTLENLRQAEVKERTAGRDLGLKAQAARQAADAAREGLVEAHAAGTDTKRAERDRAKAVVEAEDAAIRAEAATRRVERAAREREAFEIQNAQELIAELEPAARDVVERLERAARDFATADADWSTTAQRVAQLLAHVDGVSARTHQPSSHGLDDVAQQLRQALRGGTAIASPMPHAEDVDPTIKSAA